MDKSFSWLFERARRKGEFGPAGSYREDLRNAFFEMALNELPMFGEDLRSNVYPSFEMAAPAIAARKSRRGFSLPYSIMGGPSGRGIVIVTWAQVVCWDVEDPAIEALREALHSTATKVHLADSTWILDNCLSLLSSWFVNGSTEVGPGPLSMLDRRNSEFTQFGPVPRLQLKGSVPGWLPDVHKWGDYEAETMQLLREQFLPAYRKQVESATIAAGMERRKSPVHDCDSILWLIRRHCVGATVEDLAKEFNRERSVMLKGIQKAAKKVGLALSPA